MLDPNSPIADFYPTTFSVDGEGKRADWEAIVLLPFVDMTKLVNAYQQLEEMLPAEVQACNKIGKVFIFAHAQGHHETAFCQSTLPDIMDNVGVANSKVEALEPKKPLLAAIEGFTPAVSKVLFPLWECCVTYSSYTWCICD